VMRAGWMLFIGLVIVVTSWLVYSVNVRTLQHARNFTRTLHYHVLNHQTIGVYWFGQEMLNHPIHEFYQLATFQHFLLNLHKQMGRLQDISYGMLDQQALNDTLQTIVVLRRDGVAQEFEWTLREGPKADEPFAFEDLQQIKKTFIDSHSVDIKFAPIDLGNDYLWHINIHIEVLPPPRSPSQSLPSSSPS
jgi:hypothetical protein